MNRKAVSTILCAALAISLCTGCTSNGTMNTDNDLPLEQTETAVTSTTNKKVLIEADTVLQNNFDLVCDAVGINPQQILAFKQVEDWAGGDRYTFVYQKAPFVLYCNTDSTISALQIGMETDVFKQGFESYHVSDYIATEDEKITLQIKGEDTIKEYLNHPESADFHTMDWGFGKDHDLHNVSGSVTAENSFGVEDRLQFTVTYHVQDTLMTPVYVSLGGSVLLNKMESFYEPQREKADDFQESNLNVGSSSGIDGILLEDGKLGEYGVEDNVGGEVYIDFIVPSGNYMAVNLANPCKLFVIDNASNEPVATLDLPESGIEMLQISDNQHIELTMYGKVILKPID